MEGQKLYAIRNPLTKLVKIGLAIDPKERMYELETGAGTSLELALTVDTISPRAAETFVHVALADKRVFREWFALDNLEGLPELFAEASKLVASPKAKKARCAASEELLEETITCIRVEMARRGLSGADLARETGLSKQHISELLNGRVSILPPSMFRLLGSLKLKISPSRGGVA